MKKNQNEENLSRRGFLKNAVKKTLPILGTILLTTNAFGRVLNANHPVTTCDGSCAGYCTNACRGCEGSCLGLCQGSCQGGCIESCSGCTGSCSGYCTSSSQF